MDERAAGRLVGWKSIARYVARDVRTLQRWERERRFPVHRVPGGASSEVFAWPKEIEGWLRTGIAARDAPATPQRAPGLLVLPFEYHAAPSTLQFVGDSLADELIGRLAAADLASTRVLSWTTAKTFRHSPADARRIAGELDVRYLIEGSVKDAGAKWRVDIRVVDAERDAVLFTDRFACAGREALLLQSQIADAVSLHLALHFAGNQTQSEWTREVDPAALLSYFEGVNHWRAGSKASISRALELFEEALRIDPDYVPAKVVAASVLLRHRNWYGIHDAAAHRQARAWAGDCVSQAPELISTQLLDAQLAAYDYDWERAERRLSDAVSAAPASVEARCRLTNVLQLQRKFAQGDEAFGPAPTLDNSAYIAGMDATRLMWQGRHEEAITRFDDALVREPRNVYASIMRYAVALHVKDVERAQRFSASVAPEVRQPLEHWFSGTLASLQGNRAEAAKHRDAMRDLARVGQGISYLAAMIDALEGDAEGAVGLLAESVDKHEPQASCASVDPTFGWMRSHPGFKAVMRSMSLPLH